MANTASAVWDQKTCQHGSPPQIRGSGVRRLRGSRCPV